MAYTPKNANGQATSANSAPVVLASDQSTVPVSNTAGATTANQTNGTQQTKLTDGTNIANVLKSDGTAVGQNSQLVARAFMEKTGSIAAVGTIIASFDVSNYSSVSLQLSGFGSATANIQFSNDNVIFVTSPLFNSNGQGISSTNISSSGIFTGGTYGRYMKVITSAWTSGTIVATAELYSIPPTELSQSVNASQTGTWTVGANSATGSTSPTNAFYVGGTNSTGVLAGFITAGRLATAGGNNNPGDTSLSTGIIAQYLSSPPSMTTGNFSNLQVDAIANLKVTLRDAAGNARGLNIDANNNITSNMSLSGTAVKDITQFGDGVTTGIVATGQEYYRPDTADYARWRGYMPFLSSTKTADGQVKATAGFLHTVTVTATSATPVAGLLTIYDNTAESGTVLHSEWLTTSITPHTVTLDTVAGTGIYVGFDATLTGVRVTCSYI